ncbi:hypothetical protein HETIRDRAFT_118835 [Heterobasidion irregulare TC 32-1]|uniref:Uncharacterized protein n=1 Tax=Heterobasidion irregulare (strain TC 32-1) TaxID=747525 RepID=W4JUK9_HETIT|nr:uncharacterized protein HETIRDRAFT_118835 [Heterobasidion irregulare TC 32-1]ETW76571.1 hypothetical protein HETIRDRAFT_118835 [Heterobasidion irregulare TC 32-1]
MGRTTLGTDPHSGELERHADALLQQSTISAGNPEMRIATYLNDWLVPVSRSEGLHSKPTLTRPLGTSTMTDDHELSSSIPTNSPSMSTESSFQLSSSLENWALSNQNVPHPEERPMPVPNPRRSPHTVVERPSLRQREIRTAHSNPVTSSSHRVQNLPLSHGGTNEEELPVYRRNEGRKSRGTQAALRRGTTIGGNNPGNYDDADPYYRPDEGGDGYQGPYDY